FPRGKRAGGQGGWMPVVGPRVVGGGLDIFAKKKRVGWCALEGLARGWPGDRGDAGKNHRRRVEHEGNIGFPLAAMRAILGA
ncbi:hypothetical protein, partial [Roseovarius indicus]|uniref:hypothetical protein n=1 Tax=Roseovarius indicus TaxID=540747 RepID=UPI003513DC6B